MSIAEPEIQTPAAAPAAEPGPLFKRIVETFVSPGALFERFHTASPWLGAALVAGVVTAIAMALIPASAIEDMARQSMQGAPSGQAPDPATAAMFMRLSMVIGSLLYAIIGAVIIGGLLKLVLGAIMGGEATYQQYLAVYTHAALIFAVGALVSVPVVMATGDMMRQLNLALLVPNAETTSFLFKFLAQFGVFSLWQYAVIAIGAKVVNRGKLSDVAVWGGVFGIYLVMALLAAVMPSGGAG